MTRTALFATIMVVPCGCHAAPPPAAEPSPAIASTAAAADGDLEVRLRLEHATTEEVEPWLEDVLGDVRRLRTRLTVTFDAGTNSVLLSGEPDLVREVLMLLVRVDVPPEPFDSVATAPPAAAPPEPRELTPEQLDVSEAVFRRLFDSDRFGDRQRDWFFLQLPGGRDPSEAFLRRFADCAVPVAGGSLRTIAPLTDQTAIDAVRHRDDGGRGRLLHIDRLRSLQGGCWLVDAGEYQGYRAGGKDSYLLERRDGGWHVTFECCRGSY